MIFSISKRPTIDEIHQLYKEKKALPTEVVQFFFNRINEIDKNIQSFYSLSQNLAFKKAERLNKILQNFTSFEEIIKKYPLFGIPYSLKAIILAEGEVFNASSKILDGYTAPYSSTVYKKIRSKGGILMGITNMDEFAMGSSGESCYYAKTKNPFDYNRIPGGSSSGPAACVASGQVVFSLGTDTGGSIRLPASFCDIVGIKPTYGLVSRYGVMPMASSFDQVGPLTNNIKDNLLITEILANKDSNDQTSIDSEHLKKELQTILKEKQSNDKTSTSKLLTTKNPLKIGIPEEFYSDNLHPQISESLNSLQTKLEKLGHILVKVNLPLIKYAISVYYMTMSVEVASNLERIDGIRYATQQDNYNEVFFEHRYKYFGDEPKRRIMLGTYASSAGYYDAYYNTAQKVRFLAKQDFDNAFKESDVMLTPISAEFPFKIGEKTNDPLKMYLTDVFTCGINPVRIPGISVPLGLFPFREEQETVMLPIGCQILANEKREDLIYKLAFDIENIVNQQ